MAVTMMNAVFWDGTPCDSCNNRRFGGTYIHDVIRLLVTAIVASSPILITVSKKHQRTSGQRCTRHRYLKYYTF
jgi:hypothetical protein